MRLVTCIAAAALITAGGAKPAAAQSIEAMAGQMIVVGFGGDSVGDKGFQAALAEVASGGIGGVMFLKPNIAGREQTEAMTRALRAAGPAGLVPFITLDQEGGAVERLTKDVGFAEIADARTLAQSGSPAEAGKTYGEMAKGVAAWGFNFNFAPVVDLDINKNNQVIAKFGRAFAADAATVVSYAEALIAAHHRAGLLTSLKHFPGHGSSTADSHEGFVDITRSWTDKELTPYRQIIADGKADTVMVGHLIHTEVEPSGLPASLSSAWIEGVLRSELGFAGVVISDDLEMGAIRDHFDLEDTVVKAVEAGVDVLLFSNTFKPRAGLADEVRAILVAKAAAEPEFAARIAESYGRIAALKARIADKG